MVKVGDFKPTLLVGILLWTFEYFIQGSYPATLRNIGGCTCPFVPEILNREAPEVFSTSKSGITVLLGCKIPTKNNLPLLTILNFGFVALPALIKYYVIILSLKL